MKWRNRQRSTNVEDRRGRTVKRVGGGIGIGAILIAVFSLIMGENPLTVLQNLTSGTSNGYTTTDTQTSKEEDALADFVSVVLKDTEDVWTKLFRKELGKQYIKPKLVLFSGSIQSACGHASATTGPFYCPADQKVYIDLRFYNDLKTRFNAPGDFAMAYIIAHEVGHHVQHLLGITSQVQSRRARSNKKTANDLSVRLELQADFLAGVWAHHAEKSAHILEEGDLEEALRAAAAVGDDRIQMKSRGYVVPDAFTHGTSEQRMRWLKLGLITGDLDKGDTFSARNL